MITLLHSNDLHGCVGMLPWLTTLVTQERARDPDALLIDAGDVSLGGPDADLGVALLAALRYDALTPGNAENDLLEYRTHLARIEAPVLAANIAPGALGCPTAPYAMHEVGGLRVVLLGLTTPPVYPAGHPLYRPKANEITVDDPMAAAHRWLPRLRERADLLVVVSHLGLRADIRLAQEIAGIDLIIGGHSHHRLPELLRVGATQIAQAGVGGGYLGVVTVSGSPDAFQIAGRLAPLWRDIEADTGAAATIEAYLQERLPDALETVGATEGCWADPWLENRWANAVTDGLRVATGADITFYNASAIRPALDRGPLTRWDLKRCLPGIAANEEMGIDGLVAMTLTGAALRAVCEHSVSHLACDLSASVPRRFCLPSNNLLHASGLRVAVELTRPIGQRVTDLAVGGSPVRDDRRYAVVTNGFLAKGYSGYHWFREAADRRVVAAERPLLTAAVRDLRRLPECDGRLRLEYAVDQGS